MYLKKLIFTNFKNCEQAELNLSEKINCFVGNNGAGKTNVLDGIYYLSFCKSYFNSMDSQNIMHGEPFFAIHGNYSKNGDKDNLVSCLQKRGSKKQFKHNKKEYERLADHIGLYPLVMVSPYDRDLINEGSDIRRKYIDGVISQFDRIYLDKLIKKLPEQDFALLKGQKIYLECHFLEDSESLKYAKKRIELELMEKYNSTPVAEPESADMI